MPCSVEAQVAALDAANLELDAASEILVKNLQTYEIHQQHSQLARPSIKMAGLVSYASSEEEDEVQEESKKTLNSSNVSHCASKCSTIHNRSLTAQMTGN